MTFVHIDTIAPMPQMVPPAAAAFGRLRPIVLTGSGVDFLARCGDVRRPADFTSNKDGVAKRSWHKTGRAFDYDQTSKALVIVSEPANGKQYFRTYLVCSDQTGKHGVKRHLRDYRGGSANCYVFDFTAAAQIQKFLRIPAWPGWEKKAGYNRREFWHYQFNPEGLTWDEAMLALRGKVRQPADRVYGLNDRGIEVEAIQLALYRGGYLAKSAVDGIYGPITMRTVAAFQTQKKLAADGLAGPLTRAALGLI